MLHNPMQIKMTEAALERNEKFIQRYGGKISSEWMFPKVWQVLDESPEIYEDTDAFLEVTDWIVMQLTGKTDSGTAALPVQKPALA